MMKFPVTASPLRNELVVDMPTTQDGEVVVGDEPGLGIGLNQTAIKRYRVTKP